MTLENLCHAHRIGCTELGKAVEDRRAHLHTRP